MFFGQHMPKSEASEKGLSLGEMLKDVGILGALVVCFLLALFFSNALGLPTAAAYGISGVLLVAVAVLTRFSVGAWLLFVLFVVHALVGAVELGTDGWIQNITGAILSPQEGKILFVFTSLMMFLLRFCAHFIETKLGLKPVSLLFVCAAMACLGLNLVSGIAGFGAAMGALLVYAIGKTFFWPTMLAVASDRFPRTGAVAISLMGGIGMMSAGLIGGPGLGYAKDRFAAEELAKTDQALYSEWKSSGDKSKFLGFHEVQAIDPTRLEAAKKASLAKKLVDAGDKDAANLKLAAELTAEQQTVVDADIRGNRRTLKVDSLIPAGMAIGYLLLMLYFRSIGGYRPLTVDEAK
jgi:hypothetical protein